MWLSFTHKGARTPMFLVQPGSKIVKKIKGLRFGTTRRPLKVPKISAVNICNNYNNSLRITQG